MELHVDRAGRVVLPKPLRERLGFKLDSDLEVIEQPDGVLLRRPTASPSMVMLDGLWVHQGNPDPGASWDHVIDDLREERIGSDARA